MRNRNKPDSRTGWILAYMEWRASCRLLDDAYRSWVNATGPGVRLAFRRYSAALYAEERASEAYAGLVRRVGHPATPDGDLFGPLAA